jgi:hypothetical protein
MIPNPYRQLRSGLSVPSWLPEEYRPQRRVDDPKEFRFGVGGACGGCRCRRKWCLRRCTASPNQYLVVITGITERTCGNCGNLNGTFILDRESENASDNTWCSWVYVLPATLCGYISHLRLQNYEPVGSTSVYQTLIRYSDFDGTSAYGIYFRKLRTKEKPDCTSYSNEHIPLVQFSLTTCNGSLATCTITAL